jgi:V/A-type H+-transporting ATPase subunit E
MALNDILEAIGADATAEATELRSRTEHEIEAIRSQGADVAERLRLDASTAREEETADAARVIRNRARLEVSRQLRKSREAVYQSALAQVEAQLALLREDERYPRVFVDLVEESRQALPNGEVLRIDPRDLHLAQPVVEDDPRLTIEASLSTWGGVELWAQDGGRVLNTIETRLERAGRHLRQAFAQLVQPITGGLE